MTENEPEVKVIEAKVQDIGLARLKLEVKKYPSSEGASESKERYEIRSVIERPTFYKRDISEETFTVRLANILNQEIGGKEGFSVGYNGDKVVIDLPTLSDDKPSLEDRKTALDSIIKNVAENKIIPEHLGVDRSFYRT